MVIVAVDLVVTVLLPAAAVVVAAVVEGTFVDVDVTGPLGSATATAARGFTSGRRLHIGN